MSKEQPRGSFLTRLRLAPEWLFLIAAVVGGLILVALIPPVAGGNEQMNFRRVVSIANGHLLVEPAMAPGGYSDFLDVTYREFHARAQPPYSYSRRAFEEAAAVELQPDRPRLVEPNAISVLHPLTYLPQAPAVVLAQALGLSPLAIFYLGRLAGLAGAIALTFFAIRIIPFHKHTLAAVALLPPLLFSRSTLDGDQFTIAIAFLFLAMVLREISARGPISRATIAGLAVAGFLVAQTKSAYLLLPLLAVAIPTQRFGSWRRKVGACAIISMPGMVASLAWLLILKHGFFAGISYRTWSGIADPDRQFALILSDPFGYAGVLLRTLFATTFVPRALIDMLGVFGPPVMVPVIVLAATVLLLGATTASDQGPVEDAARNWRTQTLALGLAAATLLIIMTTVYMQWTRVGSPVVEGFNGRYIYPLVPLFLLLIRTAGKPVFGLRAPVWLLLFATVSVASTWWVTWRTYLA